MWAKLAAGLGRLWARSGRILGLAVLAGMLGLRVLDPGPVEALRVKTFDLFQRLKPLPALETAKQPVVIVDIDEKSLAAAGQWPWPRHYLAAIVQNLVAAGAAVIGFDIFFVEEDAQSGKRFAGRAYGLTPDLKAALEALPGTDELFAQFIAQSPVVLGQVADHGEPGPRDRRPPAVTPVATMNGDPRPHLVGFRRLIRNIEILESAAPGRGMVVLEPEFDGVVRRVPSVIRVGENIYPALAIEMLRVAAGAKQYMVKLDAQDSRAGVSSVVVAGVEIPTDRRGRLWVRFSRHQPDIYISAIDALEGKFDPVKVKGKLVLVGASAAGLLDMRTTPIEPALPGVEVHAQLLKSVMLGQHLIRPNFVDGIELFLAAAAGLALIVAIPLAAAAATLAVFVPMVAGLAYGSFYLMTEKSLVIDATFPIAAASAVFALLVFGNYLREAAQRREVRAAFAHYLAPELVDQLALDPSRLHLGGETKEMTILFCDVRGFTSISERFKENPQGLTDLINRLLTPLTDVILSRSGTIDKYMGDAIMAFWNAPLDVPDHPRRAVETALEMFAAMEKFNARRARKAAAAGVGFKGLEIGIGINTGDCVVGNMGSQQRFDYSVLGDSVNLASRLEGQSKLYDVKLVLGPNTAAKVADRFALLELDLIAVKGKAEAVRIYTIPDGAIAPDDAGFREWRAAHDAMLAAYRAQSWDDAEKQIAACRGLSGGKLDGFYNLYAERLAEFRAKPPGKDWDGVYRAETK
ncbi:MAG: CHASE2 domain-containing protein [Rhodospirillales bacterium]